MILKAGNYQFMVERISHVRFESEHAVQINPDPNGFGIILEAETAKEFCAQWKKLITLDQVLQANQQLHAQLQADAQQIGQLRMQLEAEAGKRLIRPFGH